MINIPSPLRWLLIIVFSLSLIYIGFLREKKLLIVEKGIPILLPIK